MKLINGDKLERHLDYLIKKDNQFAKMCNGNDDFSRQRKYCFEVDALAYQLCKNVMDYYLVKDVQPVNQWISVDDKLPEWDKTVLVWYASDTLFGVSEGYGLSWYHGSWRLNELNGENIRIFYWQYLPEKPKED